MSSTDHSGPFAEHPSLRFSNRGASVYYASGQPILGCSALHVNPLAPVYIAHGGVAAPATELAVYRVSRGLCTGCLSEGGGTLSTHSSGSDGVNTNHWLTGFLIYF